MFECELLKSEVIFYVFSLGFQMAGAMILIIKYLSNAKETFYREYFYGNVAIEQYADATDEVELKKDKLRDCALRIYDNRVSFGYIFLGYVLSIFGDAENVCKVCILMAVVFCMLILISIEKIVIKIVSNIVYPSDKTIKLSELGELGKELIIFVTDDKKPKTNVDDASKN